MLDGWVTWSHMSLQGCQIGQKVGNWATVGALKFGFGALIATFGLLFESMRPLSNGN